MNDSTDPALIPVPAYHAHPTPAAFDRAWETLHSYLSDSEKHQLDTLGYFDVPSRLTEGRVYRIPNHDATVAVRDHDKRTYSICCRPEDTSIPWPDVMLAYKLGLESDEERWLETANKWEAESTWLYDEYIGGERLNAADVILNGQRPMVGRMVL